MRLSLDCSGCRATLTSGSHLPPLMAKKEKVKAKKERGVTEMGIFYKNGEGDGRNCPPSSLSSSSNDYYKKKGGNTRKKRISSNSYDFSSSSSMNRSDGHGFFSSGKDEEIGALFSSKSFSSDSSTYYHYPSSNSTKIKNKQKKIPPKIGIRDYNKRDVSHGLHPLLSISSGEKKEKAPVVEVDSGVAVVRRSSDPYGDFRRSMVEMIMARRKISAGGLNRLLQCYLSLNSPQHHPVILKAFSDIYMGSSVQQLTN